MAKFVQPFDFSRSLADTNLLGRIKAPLVRAVVKERENEEGFIKNKKLKAKKKGEKWFYKKTMPRKMRRNRAGCSRSRVSGPLFPTHVH